MLKTYEILVVFISFILIVKSIRRLIWMSKSIYFIHLLFCFIFVLPIILDYLIGYPTYNTKYYGFILSYNDTATRFIYATYVLLSQLIMLLIGNIRINKKGKIYLLVDSKKAINKVKELSSTTDLDYNTKNYNRYVDFLLLFASIITVLLVLIFPISKEILWTYDWRNKGIIIEGQKYYSTIERLSYISIISGIIYILGKKRSIITKIIIPLFIFMTICTQGKRSILFFMILAIISYLFINVKLSKRKWIFILAIISAVGIVSYSIYIKVFYRGYSGFDSLYTTLRIDFFRDDTTKLVIYSLLNPNSIKILDYPGQSIITQIGALFPLQFLDVPVIGYNTYLTSALIGASYKYSAQNWMTTSIFDEMLANFSFFGFWIAPMVLGIFSKIADKQNCKIKPITISSLILLMMYSPSYILWYMQFWFIITLAEKVAKNKNIQLFNENDLYNRGLL